MESVATRFLGGNHDDAHGHSHHSHGADGHTHDQGDLSVTAFKWIMLGCMVICVSTFGILPKLFIRCRDNENALSFLNCFSAGLFMAMALVHMLPHAVDHYGMWGRKEKIERPFPVPYVCFFLGYIIILTIDRVIAKAYHLGHDHGKLDEQLNHVKGHGHGHSHEHDHAHSHGKSDDKKKADGQVVSDTSRNESNRKLKANQVCSDEEGSPSALPNRADETDEPNKAAQKQKEEKEDADSKVTVSKTAAIILVLAIGTHNIFEGMAFGLMETVDQAAQLAAGILIHMSAEALSLGGAFARSGYKTKEIMVLLLIFSCITPIGAIIGMQI